MAKRDNIKFRGVLGGFRKKDVNEYIKETDLRHSQEVEELGRRLKESEDELEPVKAKVRVLEEEKKSYEEKVSALETERDEYLNESESFQNDIVELQNDVDRLSVEKAELEKSVAALTERIAALEKELDAAKSANGDKNTAAPLSTAEKVRARLDHIKGDTNRTSEEIISTARATAQKMISSAERECAAKRAECDAAVTKIRTETEEQADYIRERDELDGMIAKQQEKLALLEQSIAEINSCVNDMETEIKALLTKISSRADEMNGRITYYQEYLADGMEEKLTQIGKSVGDQRS